MSNNNLVVLAVAAVAAVMMMKKAGAATATAASRSAPVQNKNVNDQLWTNLLGSGWKALTDAQNSDGTPAFLMKNSFGQTVTSDGKPVGQEMQDLFPATFGQNLPVDTTAGGTDYAASLFKFGG